jgi:chemotaxis signal transduction protein
MSHLVPTSAKPLILPDGSTKNLELVVTCSIGHQQYGLPIEAVREVVRLPALLTLADAPPFLCGLLNLRGSYLPVLDSRVLMGETPTYALSKQIIITGYNAPQFGLLVDEVQEVLTIQNSQWTTIGQNFAASFLQGVIHQDHQSVILFDLAALLALIPDNTSNPH